MPRRTTSRRAIRPFVSLPRHSRRALVIALQGRMLRHTEFTGSTLFDSDHLLIGPDDMASGCTPWWM